jgi:two-component system heavy metal sensor histidine kinase CusS
VAFFVVVLGTLLSGVLALFVARRGLAPIAEVAARAEQVTAQRLGTALAAEDAPTEIRGLAGLGLAIVDSIMRLHGGVARAESGAFGVRFTLRFPGAANLAKT